MSATEEARAALAEWDAAPPVFLGGNRALVGRVVSALRKVIALIEAPADVAQVDCPHWAPGRITLRNGCTACAAEPARGATP